MKVRIFPVRDPHHDTDHSYATVTLSPSDLYAPARIGPLQLRNRIVMAPLTRNRAAGNVPNALMARYYRQRASAGAIITEGTSPSPNGLGYVRIPGMFTRAHEEGWRLVTDAVHAEGGTIILQLMHTGRISHPRNLPPGARVLAPSAVQAAGTIVAEGEGRVPIPAPNAMSAQDIALAIREYAEAASRAMAAGFDGVELHGANGYLIEEFLRPATNLRTDDYGGAAEARMRFALEVARAAAGAIGADRVGMRLSPFGVAGDMHDHSSMEEDYTLLARELGKVGLLYLHVTDASTPTAPPVPESVKRSIRAAFPGALLLCGGYDAARAQADVAAGRADLVAAGRLFIANPDLPERWRRGLPTAAPDRSTFYTDGEKGYTDYPPCDPPAA